VQLVRGNGAVVTTGNGDEKLDFLAGIAVSALGHNHPRLERELSEQLQHAVHLSNLWHHPLQLEVATRLAGACGLDRVFFTTSGTEAIEACLKFARKVQVQRGNTERTGFVAFEGAFHGRSMGALSVTHAESYRKPFGPLVPGVSFVPREDQSALRTAVRTAPPAAVILEPIQGEGGIVEFTPAFLRFVRELCDQTGTLLIHDEVQTGCGRTGTFLAAQAHGVTPDLVALAKPIACGLPMGAAVVSEAVATCIQPGDHGSTFAGNPLACRAAKVFLDELDAGGLQSRVTLLGGRLGQGLRALAARFPCIRGVRGRGLIQGLLLDRPGKDLADQLFERGLIVNCTAGNVIRFLPPYVITDQQVDQALALLAETLPTGVPA
jgi:predicted acetylornithine/succinylornithine family transaminase